MNLCATTHSSSRILSRRSYWRMQFNCASFFQCVPSLNRTSTRLNCNPDQLAGVISALALPDLPASTDAVSPTFCEVSRNEGPVGPETCIRPFTLTVKASTVLFERFLILNESLPRCGIPKLGVLMPATPGSNLTAVISNGQEGAGCWAAATVQLQMAMSTMTGILVHIRI